MEELMPSPEAAKAFLIEKGILKEVDEDKHSGLADSGCCGHELLQAGVDDTAFEAAQHDYGLVDVEERLTQLAMEEMLPESADDQMAELEFEY